MVGDVRIARERGIEFQMTVHAELGSFKVVSVMTKICIL